MIKHNSRCLNEILVRLTKPVYYSGDWLKCRLDVGTVYSTGEANASLPKNDDQHSENENDVYLDMVTIQFCGVIGDHVNTTTGTTKSHNDDFQFLSSHKSSDMSCHSDKTIPALERHTEVLYSSSCQCHNLAKGNHDPSTGYSQIPSDAEKVFDSDFFGGASFVLKSETVIVCSDLRLYDNKITSYGFHCKLPSFIPPTYCGESLRLGYFLCIFVQRRERRESRHLSHDDSQDGPIVTYHTHVIPIHLLGPTIIGVPVIPGPIVATKKHRLTAPWCQAEIARRISRRTSTPITNTGSGGIQPVTTTGSGGIDRPILFDFCCSTWSITSPKFEKAASTDDMSIKDSDKDGGFISYEHEIDDAGKMLWAVSKQLRKNRIIDAIGKLPLRHVTYLISPEALLNSYTILIKADETHRTNCDVSKIVEKIFDKFTNYNIFKNIDDQTYRNSSNKYETGGPMTCGMGSTDEEGLSMYPLPTRSYVVPLWKQSPMTYMNNEMANFDAFDHSIYNNAIKNITGAEPPLNEFEDSLASWLKSDANCDGSNLIENSDDEENQSSPVNSITEAAETFRISTNHLTIGLLQLIGIRRIKTTGLSHHYSHSIDTCSNGRGLSTSSKTDNQYKPIYVVYTGMPFTIKIDFTKSGARDDWDPSAVYCSDIYVTLMRHDVVSETNIATTTQHMDVSKVKDIRTHMVHEHHEIVSDNNTVVSFFFTVPHMTTPSFVSPIVKVHYTLHFKFVYNDAMEGPLQQPVSRKTEANMVGPIYRVRAFNSPTSISRLHHRKMQTIEPTLELPVIVSITPNRYFKPLDKPVPNCNNHSLCNGYCARRNSPMNFIGRRFAGKVQTVLML